MFILKIVCILAYCSYNSIQAVEAKRLHALRRSTRIVDIHRASLQSDPIPSPRIRPLTMHGITMPLFILPDDTHETLITNDHYETAKRLETIGQQNKETGQIIYVQRTVMDRIAHLKPHHDDVPMLSRDADDKIAEDPRSILFLLRELNTKSSHQQQDELSSELRQSPEQAMPPLELFPELTQEITEDDFLTSKSFPLSSTPASLPQEAAFIQAPILMPTRSSNVLPSSQTENSLSNMFQQPETIHSESHLSSVSMKSTLVHPLTLHRSGYSPEIGPKGSPLLSSALDASTIQTQNTGLDCVKPTINTEGAESPVKKPHETTPLLSPRKHHNTHNNRSCCQWLLCCFSKCRKT